MSERISHEKFKEKTLYNPEVRKEYELLLAFDNAHRAYGDYCMIGVMSDEETKELRKKFADKLRYLKNMRRASVSFEDDRSKGLELYYLFDAEISVLLDRLDYMKRNGSLNK